MATDEKTVKQANLGVLIRNGWQLRSAAEQDGALIVTVWDKDGEEKTLRVQSPVRPEPRIKQDEQPSQEETAAEQAKEAKDAEKEGRKPEDTKTTSRRKSG